VLTRCPECGLQVSEKAPTCPKCGAVIGYPPFYTTVERDGLNISSLLCDWWNEFLDDSALGSGQAIQCLVGHRDDEEMVELTWKNGRKLAEAMQKRAAQLPGKSPEANELKLAAEYVRVTCQFANLIRWCFHRENKWSADTIRLELDSILGKLNALQDSCKNDVNNEFLNSEIETCKRFGAKIQTERSTAPTAPPSTSSPKGSGCLILVILLIALTITLTYTASLLLMPLFINHDFSSR
jgi:hypothetical protein